MPSDLELMQIQASTLYQFDDRLRLLCVNEESSRPAPRVFIGRTANGNMWRFRHDLPEPLIRTLTELLRAEPAPDDLTQPPACFEAIRAALTDHGESPAVWHGPAWHFPDNLPTPEMEVARIHPENANLLRRAFADLIAELPWRQPCRAVVRDGQAVSVCFSARNSAAAAEAGVETAADERGHGYAPVAVAAWANAVRQEGRLPLYSTSWQNTASQAVARKLGLVLYGADLSFA